MVRNTLVRWALFIGVVVSAAAAFADPQVSAGPEDWERVASGLEFPEGPAWDGRGTLYVSDCKGGRIVAVGAGESETWVSSGDTAIESTNGLTCFRDGSLFACDFGLGAIVRIGGDRVATVVVSESGGTRFHRPNDLAFDPTGALYFTDPRSYRREDPDGILYRVEPDATSVRPVATKLAFPNGLAFSAGGRHLYVCESALSRVTRFTVGSDGALSGKKTFVELPGADPDGINFDRAGNLYVAHFGGGAVIVVDPEGAVIRRIPAPGRKPSNVEFAGDDLRTLYITEVETGGVYRMRMDTGGLPLFCAPDARGGGNP